MEYTTPFCSDPGCKIPLVAEGDEGSRTLGELGLRNGDMVYCKVVPETCAEGSAAGGDAAAAAVSGGPAADDADAAAAAAAAGGGVKGSTTMKRVIGKDGNIQLVPTEAVSSDDGKRGFRKGQMVRTPCMHCLVMLSLWICVRVCVCGHSILVEADE